MIARSANDTRTVLLISLIRIGREAVANAVRHAQPGRIDVLVVYEPQRVRLEVCDDGAGFPLKGDEVDSLNGHWGLRDPGAGGKGVRNARRSWPGRPGTRVDLSVPILRCRQVRRVHTKLVRRFLESPREPHTWGETG